MKYKERNILDWAAPKAQAGHGFEKLLILGPFKSTAGHKPLPKNTTEPRNFSILYLYC